MDAASRLSAPRPSGRLLLEQARFLRDLARALVRDPAAADDVVQDTYAAALAREAPRRPRAWLGTIARRLALKRLRADGRRRRRETAAVRTGTAPPADEAVARLEIERRLVDAVLTHEKDWWGNVRPHMVHALVAMGPDALPAILELARHEDPRARASGVTALGKLRHEPALPLLLAALGSDEARVRDAAARAVARFEGIAVRPLLSRLDLPGAADALRLIGKPAAAPLADALFDPERAAGAARALRELGANARPALEAIERAVADPGHPGRADLIRALRVLPASRRTEAVVLDALRSGDADARAAVLATRELDADALHRLLDDPEAALRVAAAGRLLKAGRHEDAAWRVLLAEYGREDARRIVAMAGPGDRGAEIAAAAERLSPEEWHYRDLWTLARAGEEAALRRMAARAPGKVREAIRGVLRRAGERSRAGATRMSASSIPELAAKAETDGSGLAIFRLGGRKDPAAVAALARILRERTAKKWPRAIQAVGRQGAAGAPAAPELAALLETEHARAAAVALGRIGPEARVAAPALKRAAGSVWARKAHLAAEALVLVTGDTEPFAALLEPDAFRLRSTLNRLRFPRRPIPALVPPLLPLLDHRDLEIRLYAA